MTDGRYQFHLEYECIAWHHLLSEFHIVYLEEISAVEFGIIHITQHQESTSLSHCLYLEHSRHNGFAGCPWKKGSLLVTFLMATMLFSRISITLSTSCIGYLWGRI